MNNELEISETQNHLALLGDSPRMQSPALQVLLDEKLFMKIERMAQLMANAHGIVPDHLIKQSCACFAIIVSSITWKLDPFKVANSTYLPSANGKIAYEGKLVQAILENSGKLDGGVNYEHFGDWSKIFGKFEIAKSEKGKEYAKRTWTRADTKGLGVKVSAKIKGEKEPRTMEFYLEQAFPLNSTLWATNPKLQICYAAVRAFANTACPGIFIGLPVEDDLHQVIDVTPEKEEPQPKKAKQTLADILQTAAPVVDVSAAQEVEEEPKDVKYYVGLYDSIQTEAQRQEFMNADHDRLFAIWKAFPELEEAQNRMNARLKQTTGAK